MNYEFLFSGFFLGIIATIAVLSFAVFGGATGLVRLSRQYSDWRKLRMRLLTDRQKRDYLSWSGFALICVGAYVIAGVVGLGVIAFLLGAAMVFSAIKKGE